MKAEKELTQHFIVADPVFSKQKNKYRLDLQIVFKRRQTTEAMMTFFPSLLLITISYSTSFFRLPNFFNTAITVNLTVMLTTTTLLISVVKKLAPTSYIKWIEAWLIFAQLIPFTHVILITCIERVKEMKEKEKAEEKEKRKEEDPQMERSKEHIWLDVANKLVKVKLFPRTLQLGFVQVHPLVPAQEKAPEKTHVDYGNILSLIGKFTLTNISVFISLFQKQKQFLLW